MRINYDGRRFRNTAGPPTEAPVAAYHQEDELVWADFAGGDVRRGSLAGTCAPDGVLDFAYSMVLDGGRVVSGHSVNTPEVLPDGRIRLHERWERFGAHADSGTSCIEEIRE